MIGMDVRLPIGILFTGIGALLILAGLITSAADLRLATVGFNINLAWGAVLLVFGLAAIALSRATRDPRK